MPDRIRHPTVRRGLVIFGAFVSLHMAAVALARWAGASALAAALAVWMVLGAGPLTAWWWYEWTARDKPDLARTTPPGFFGVAGLTVFSAGSTAVMAGLALMSSLRAAHPGLLCIVGWELLVALAAVALGSWQPWARRVVCVTSVIDIAIAVWGAVLLSPMGGAMTFTAVLMGLGAAMHGFRGVALLGMLAASRGPRGARRARTPSTA